MKNEKNTLSQLSNLILAFLFLANREVYFLELAEKLNITEQDVKISILEINNFFESTCLTISTTEKSALLKLKKDYALQLPEEMRQPTFALSSQALETLAVIIYKQPCTKQEIEKIRKVDCEKTLQSLLNIGFIKKIATMNQAGSPVLYSVTEKCIHAFGFKTYEEMLECIKEKIEPKDNQKNHTFVL